MSVRNLLDINKPWRVVLVGIGGYGQLYVRAAVERQQKGLIELVGLVDPAAQASGEYDKVAHLPCYASLEDFYSEHQADLVIISSPIQYHARQVCTALSQGSHVLCEKPLCATDDEAQAMIHAQQASARIAGIGFQWSYAPAVLRAKQEIMNGQWGKFRQLRCKVYWPRAFSYYQRNNWAGRIKTGRGDFVLDSILNNATAHHLHQMLFILGNQISKAAVPDKIEAALFRAYPIETFDTAFVRMQFGSIPAWIGVSHVTDRLQEPVFKYELEKGTFFSAADDHLMLRQADGTVDDYGLMSAGSVDNKLDTILRAMSTGEQIPCDVHTASAHHHVISVLSSDFSVNHFAPDQVVSVTDQYASGDERLVVPGLREELDRCYETLTLPDAACLSLHN